MKLQEVVDNRPLIWRLVAQQLAKGKNVMYYGQMPNSSSHLVGRIEDVGDTGATIKDVIHRSNLIINFRPEDDLELTLRPSIDTKYIDFVLETKYRSGEDAE